MLFVLASILSGCTVGQNNFTDLQTKLDEIRRSPPGKIEPMPEFQVYEVYKYAASLLRSPFQPPLVVDQIAFTPQGKKVEPDFKEEKILEEWLFSVEAQLETVKRLRKLIPHVTFAVEVDQQFHREKKYVPRWDIGADNVGAEKIEELIKRPALKMLARCAHGEFTSDQMLALASKALVGIATVTHSNSTDSLLEISADGVSKGATLAKMAARHGLTADDCVTFGDNPNDFSMLSWAGRSWAMADGHPDLMKYAKFQTDAHQEDGVAKVIERLLELPE